jgi:carboxypeptidase C (cathepsin A)
MRLASISVFLLISSLFAQEHPPAAGGRAHEAAAGDAKPPAAQPPAPVETKSVTQHSIEINGKKLDYEATAGTLILKKDEKPWASMFYVAYTVLNGQAPNPNRPITFAFNGGPGSSSVWLHLGALGPRRVEMAAGGEQPKPPYRLIDNQDTALAFTDLVFIDPVTTGFSRAAPGEQDKQFHGFEGDLDSVSEFIRFYLTKSQRWASPKFLAGESYGTTRAAALSDKLLEDEGIYLNGITLISSVLNFETISFARGNDLPYALFLPSFTAAAWYHKKLPKDLQGDLEKALGEARKFAGGEYTTALMKGDKLTAAERTTIAHEVARLTGLPESYVLECNLRISEPRFTKELLREERKTIGRYDSRLEGEDIDAAGDRPEYDPSYASVQGVYTAMFNSYVRNDLKYDSDLPYQVLTDKVQPWSYDHFQNRYVNVADMLRQAMTQNPSLKVMIANGYYDLATPFFATEYTVNHIGLEPALSDHISLTYCDAGHMLYTKQSCLDSLHGAMAEFYQKALPTAP